MVKIKVLKMDPNIYAMVLDTLSQATSQDTSVLKPAEKKLQDWEIEPGYYSVLLDVLSNHSIDVNVRWLAVMCFKNGVERFWRQNTPHAISDEEKHKLREGLLSNSILNEPVTQVATQQAVLISRIARLDCPTKWPNLVPVLLNAFKAPQPVMRHRSLLIFHHVVKALASKRIARDRRTFQELTETVYSYILNLWHENTELFLQEIQESAATEVITEHLEKALLCLRILRKLTVYGFKKIEDMRDAVAFLNIVYDRAKKSLESRKLLKGRGIYPLELCEKFIIHLTKVILDVLSTHPHSFAPLISSSLEFTIFYCFTEAGMALIYERFTIQCLNIIKGVLQCLEYKLPKNFDIVKDNVNPLTLQAHQSKMEILNPNTVAHMCRQLVTHYFLLSSDDLALWDAEPEAFATDEVGESWKYSLRPCTEAVFMELFQEFRAHLSSELVGLLTRLHEQPIMPDNLAGILKKDAIYNAVGLAAFDLYDDIDFDEWFKNVLTQELNVKDDNYRIIRRRVCQLIGQWCGVRASQSLRPALYEALLEPLSSATEDAAVKLAAAEALRSTIDDFSFNVEQFAPYAPHAISALYQLLVESEDCDTKMHVLHVLSFVTLRMGNSADSGLTCPVFNYLPELWAHAADHNMLRAAILSTIINLIKAVGSCTLNVLPWVMSVIDEATRVSEPAHVYLLEDALELWLVLVETSEAQTPELMKLADNLYPILEQSTEHLRIIIYIMQAYTLLSPEEFLLGAGGRCMTLLEELLADLRVEGVTAILKMAEICINVMYPDKNILLGVKVVWPIILRIIRTLLDSEDLPLILSVQLSLLSRIILISTDVFYKAVQEASVGQVKYECNPTLVLARLMHVWTDSMNLVTQVERWKLIALGMSALLTTKNTAVLEKFPAIMLVLTEVLNDVMKLDETGAYVDGLLAPPDSRPPSPLEGRGSTTRWGPNSTTGDDKQTPHEVRRRRLTSTHLAYEHDLRGAVHSQLQILESQVGREYFARLIQSVDEETMKQIREYIPL